MVSFLQLWLPRWVFSPVSLRLRALRIVASRHIRLSALNSRVKRLEYANDGFDSIAGYYTFQPAFQQLEAEKRAGVQYVNLVNLPT